MRAAEQGHDVEALMERAGRALQRRPRRYPERPDRSGCGKVANGGDGKSLARAAESDVRLEELDGDFDVVIELVRDRVPRRARPDAAALIEGSTAWAFPCRCRYPSGVEASTGEVRGSVRASSP